MIRRLRLHALGTMAVVVAFITGALASGLWFSSTQAWSQFLSRSFLAGVSLHESLRIGAALPPGVHARVLAPAEVELANRGEFGRLSGLGQPTYVTTVSIHGQSRDVIGGESVSFAIVSGDLRYSVRDVVSAPGQSAAEKTGNITRLLATYCSEPILFARLHDGSWNRIDGTAIWGCSAAPRDNRVIAVLLAAISLAILITQIAEVSARFDRFARALRARRQFGGPERYVSEGPRELSDIIDAVNVHLEDERANLARRATVLSGVSHDLGTPATRLRLRTALIPDADLRSKLDADIDRMTGMIESVLTYTRAELNAEEPRELALQSFVEAVVDDYRDIGKPVELRHGAPRKIEGGRSIFSAKAHSAAMPDLQRVLVTARPISLNRALSNLIDNALKYGRRASVELHADADKATIVVEDEASEIEIADIEAAVAPFVRGENTASIDGFGLGLTIVSTVAEQHGGRLYFERGRHGLRANLEIARGTRPSVNSGPVRAD